MNALTPLRLSTAVACPERVPRRVGPIEERLRGAVTHLPGLPRAIVTARLRRIAMLAARHADWAAQAADDAEAAADSLAPALRRGLDAEPVARGLALMREVAHRVLGMRPYDVQLMGAWAMLQGRLAELATGEGKTLAASLAAGIAALSGRTVHVVTVNDYLAERDHATLLPFYAALGLRAGLVIHGQSPEERRAAYACDIVYASNKELTFDYLRDQIARRGAPSRLHARLHPLAGGGGAGTVMNGLVFAIIDEADSVLIDEARTPLIISASVEGDDDYRAAQEALALVTGLVDGDDYVVDRSERRIELTPDGQRRIAALSDSTSSAWDASLSRAELVRKALTARLLFERDVHYLVRNGKVEIIDEYTGRIMPDRFWNDGLQQMVEAKEGCAPSQARDSVARITYQRFFTRYLHLCGMSGTLAEVGPELAAVYGLGVVCVPTHRASRRRVERQIIVVDEATKWRRIADTALALSKAGRPVLIGTRSVAASERASALLSAAGADHALLNAAQDSQEADIIAGAGAAGRITIATNMAGRGTDISLGQGVAESGGLAVILSERHDSGRIDRQLAGRGARQGEPGSFIAIISLEDSLLDPLRLTTIGRLILKLAKLRPNAAAPLFTLAQRRAQRRHRAVRRELMRFDARLAATLSFAGRPD